MTLFRLRKPDYYTKDLFDKETLERIYQLAQNNLATSLDAGQEVHQRLLGDYLSPVSRSGYEFSETRPFQPGDNVRFINWRRYANSGELYINQFHEERRPQCWVIMDRRAGMQFGTRVRLKVTQAALLATFHIYKALHHKLEVGGAVLEERVHWYQPTASGHGVLPLAKHIRRGCPPLHGRHAQSSLGLTLRSLHAQLNPGCFIFLISDFAGLDTTAMHTLSALASKHTLAALHIIDRVELAFPDCQHLCIENELNHHLVDIGDKQTNSIADINTLLESSISETESRLKQVNLTYRRMRCDEALPDVIRTDT